MSKDNRFDPWVVPLIAYRVDLPLSVAETAERLRQLVAAFGTPTSDEKPFRGEVTDENFALQVRIPTSGLATSFVPLERTLVVVGGTMESKGEGCHLVVSMRQPLPAFFLLVLIWSGFIYTVAAGASPFLLFTPFTGHAMLIVFFRFTAYQRVLRPLRRVLETQLG